MYLLKRYIRRAIINIYWYTMPKRLKVSVAGTITQYLPWFRGDNKKTDKFLYQFGEKGKILVASSGRGYNSKDYTYSWKKAYKRVLEVEKEMRQRELQFQLNMELRKLQDES